MMTREDKLRVRYEALVLAQNLHMLETADHSPGAVLETARLYYNFIMGKDKND